MAKIRKKTADGAAKEKTQSVPPEAESKIFCKARNKGEREKERAEAKKEKSGKSAGKAREQGGSIRTGGIELGCNMQV